MMRILIVTSVEREADAIGSVDHAQVIVGGIGRVNAACATTETILKEGPFDVVICAGVAGALPGVESRGADGLKFAVSIGDVAAASRCVYLEEGMVTPAGFRDIRSLGFSLGDFEGNAVPVDPRLLRIAGEIFRPGIVATVATCSGTDEAARAVAQRTGAVAEAMEGAAVVQAARRLGVPAIEVRAISNTTGDRESQRWDLKRGLRALGEAVPRFVSAIRTQFVLPGGD